MTNRDRLLGLGALLGVALALGLGTGPVARAQQGGTCGQSATLIHDIQGIGGRAPLADQTVTIEGVVVGSFQDATAQLGGFFVQEETGEFDENPLTSEGIFVDSTDSRVDVSLGDVVRVTGMVVEAADAGASRTQLASVQSIMVCGHDARLEPVTLMLPVRDTSAWEAFEGMLVTFPQTLTVSEVYNLGRYGEVLLSAHGRLYQPTHVARPGPEALEVRAANALRSIILDDGSSQQNLDPTFYPTGGLSAANALRSGDTVSGLTAVVDQRHGTYRLYAAYPPEFEPAYPRAVQPPEVDGGLRIASFNVLNYFNGDGAGGGFPTERGASTAEEFERQRTKIVSTLLALDAHVVGLLEIENDGAGPTSALADLVGALNEASDAAVYTLVPDPDSYPLAGDGGDAIKPAIIYQLAAVQPVGAAVTTLDAPFDARRPPVAQAFEDLASGERFVVVVVHLKSKDCSGAESDPDRGDGQGCWNQERTEAARALVTWLATDPTGTGDPDILLLGDFNAYGQEDPLRVLHEAGFHDLAGDFGAPEIPYSYVYFGQAGTLDYAFASPTLREQVRGATLWHVNADEPNVFDYNVEYKSANHVASLYDSGPFRASDHDPILVGLAFEPPRPEFVAAAVQATPVPTTADPTPAPSPTVAPTATPRATATAAPTQEPTAAPTTALTSTPDPPEPTLVTGADEPDEPVTVAADVDVDRGGRTAAGIAVLAALIVVAIAIAGSWRFQRSRGR